MAKELNLRVSLSGACRNAADVMWLLMFELQSRVTPEEWEQFECANQPLAEIGMLREIAKHSRQVAEGESTLAEFAERYCLVEEDGK